METPETPAENRAQRPKRKRADYEVVEYADGVDPETAVNVHPVAPAARLRSQAGAVILGLLAMPIAIVFFVLGSANVTQASGNSVAGVVATHSVFYLFSMGMLQIIMAALILIAMVFYTGIFTPLVLGVSSLWPLVITLFSGHITAFFAPQAGLGEDLASRFGIALSMSTATGLFPTMAIVLMTTAVGARQALEAGRALARENLALEETDRTPVPPQAPPSRMRDHVISVIAACVGIGVGLLALIPLHNRLAGAADTGLGNAPMVIQVGVPIIGVALFFLATLTVSRSAIGLPVAGLLICFLPGLIMTLGLILLPSFTAGWLTWLTHLLQTSMQITGGPLMTIGAVMISCGIAAYWGRAMGYRDEYKAHKTAAHSAEAKPGDQPGN